MMSLGFLALNISELETGGLLYYEADRDVVFEDCFDIDISLGIPIDGNLYVTWTL